MFTQFIHIYCYGWAAVAVSNNVVPTMLCVRMCRVFELDAIAPNDNKNK